MPEQDILKLVGLFLVISFIVIPIMFGVVIPTINNAFNPQECPPCDCSSYENNLTECLKHNQNLSNEITFLTNKTNQTIPEIPPEDYEVYINFTAVTVITDTFFFIIFLTLGISLFKLNILPKRWEDELSKDKWMFITKIIRWVSLGIAILILFKYLYYLFIV